MIVVDTSVFVCIAMGEPDYPRFVEALRMAPARAMSAGSYLECAIIAQSRLGGRGALDEWLRAETIEIAPVDHDLAALAADAFASFGRGRHPAGLNYGDCFAYALAKSRRARILYKGDDFARTDIESALSQLEPPSTA